MGIVPHDDAVVHLVGAASIEPHDDWQTAQRRYLSEGSVAAKLRISCGVERAATD